MHEARERRGALAALALAMLLSSLGTSIANVALPTLAREFSASFQAVQWIVLAYLLAVTALIVSVGRLGDLLGRRTLLLFGIGLFSLASALCGASSTLGFLIAARALQGLGAAIMMSLSVASVSELVSKERIGSAMGLLGTTSAIGTALGPSLGGVLIAGFGWRAIFWVKVPLGVIALWVAQRALPVQHAQASSGRPRFDHLGTLLLAFTLGAYALAATLGRGHFDHVNALLLVCALASLALFVFVEGRASAPLIQLSLFRSASLDASLLMSTLVSTVMMATLVVGPFYLSRALGLSAALVGVVMSAGPLVAAVTGVPAGRVVDRFGAQRMTSLGLAGIAAGSLLLSIVPARFGLAGYIIPTVLSTAGYALFQAANNTAVMANVDATRRGLVSGMLNLSRNLGLITGASAMGAVFALAAATSDVAQASPAAASSGMRTTFSVALVLALAALALSRAGAQHRAGGDQERILRAVREVREEHAHERLGFKH